MFNRITEITLNEKKHIFFNFLPHFNMRRNQALLVAQN